MKHVVLKGKKATSSGWSLERIFREWTRGKVCSTTNAVDRLLFGRCQISLCLYESRPLEKNVDTTNVIYSSQVQITIELAFILHCQGGV